MAMDGKAGWSPGLGNESELQVNFYLGTTAKNWKSVYKLSWPYSLDVSWSFQGASQSIAGSGPLKQTGWEYLPPHAMEMAFRSSSYSLSAAN